MNQPRYFGLKLGLAFLIGLIGLVGVFLGQVVKTQAQGDPNYSLRFYGHGVNDIDRVKIKIHNPEVPADVGGDFTLEFWMKANSGENESASASCGSFNWIYGNIIFDRDVEGSVVSGGDYGISMYVEEIGGEPVGRIRFGAANSSGEETICGSTDVANGVWHHIAVTRRSSNGQMRIYVDGQQDAQGTGPTGDISYGGGDSGNNPYLVIGAEKHDFNVNNYPSYSGLVDEVRISDVVRYTSNFTPPTAPFTTDGDTVALYHFDEGPAGPCSTNQQITDSSGASGGPSHGFCRYGGSSLAGPVFSTDVPSFTPPPPDTTPPVISNVTEENLTETSVTITWETDEPATSQVAYGLSLTSEMNTTETTTYATSHSVTLTGLQPGTDYVYEVRSRDAAENLETDGEFGFTTLQDLPPVISDLAARAVDTSAVITWQTDEPATSQVRYGISSTSEMSTTQTTALTTFHQVALTDLISDTTYLYQVASRDEEGNLVVGAEESFTTLDPVDVSKVFLPLVVK